jgi:NACHT domain-containing protein
MEPMISHNAARATQLGIPTYLLVPGPDSSVPVPPVETLAQELPLDQLTWENFERLCLRVVESESMIEQCYEYGTRGQDQHGIDLLARNRNDGNISVYQCKRVKAFGPASIEAAVTKFLQESWAGTAAHFVLCTSNDLRTKDCVDEINLQEKRLLEYKTGFEVWNTTRLSGKLKKLPELVYDFFGPAWLVAFCGREYESLISKRLSPQKVEQYRSRLATFYRNIFEQNDPGIPTLANPVAPRIDFAERFVLPHLVDHETVLSPDSRSKANAFDRATDDKDESDLRRETRSSPAETKESREVRFPVDDWISTTKRALIVGIAGSGKTTLLRYIILDLLSSAPTLPAVAEQLGRNLPIWIPFAFWTHTLHRQKGASIVDVLRGWFHSWGEDQLFSLVQEAIDDERLLLIVDGLDEWVDEPTGTLAFAQFESFLDMRALPALSSARPYALNWLKLSGSWRLARVADLSAQERERVCEIWFRLRAKSSGKPESQDGVQHGVSSLIADFDHSVDLDELSRVPLFLLLLIALRFQGAALPSGRFDAYEALIRHMLRDHPQRKRSAAAIIPTDQLSEREIQTILARLAYEIQVEQTGGTISETDFESLLIEILTSTQDNGLGLPSAEARKIAKGFISIEEGSLGLLVPQGMRTFGFLHRSFQERLAAMHFASKSLDDQTAIVRAYANSSQWRETLLHLCSMTPRSNELSRLLFAISDVSDNQFQREESEDFRIEVAFSDFDLPLQEIKEIAALAFNIVELSTDMERRRRILRHCLNGLQARRTRQLVQPKLNEWSIARAPWKSNWLNQLEHWPKDDLTKAIVRRGLNDEDVYTIRAAAGAYAKAFRSDSDVADAFVRLAESAYSIDQRAACIEALLAVWPERPELASVSLATKSTEIPLLHALGLLASAKLGNVSQEDAVDALELATDRIGGPLPYQWSDLLGPLLVEVAKIHTSMIKLACLYAVEENFQRHWHSAAGVDRDVAWFVLMTSYAQDADVISLLAKELGKEHPFLSMNRIDIWKIIASSYRGVEEVERAMDARIVTFNAAQPSEAHHAALLTRSDIAKKKMLEMLRDSFPHWAASALLEGWGMEDSEVATALRASALGNERRASEVGLFIPRILGKTEGRERLIQLLEHPEAYRLDFVIAGLFQEESNKHDEALISKVTKAVQEKDDFWDQNISTLIAHCPESPQVRALTLQHLQSRTPSIAQIAGSYSNDLEIRSILSRMMTPLPRELRSDIIAALSRSAAMGEQTEFILSRWDFESDASVKTKMSIGYHAHLARVNSIPSESMEALTTAAKSYGPDHDDRRQAAFCGIVLLKRFDIYFDNKERIGDPTGLSIPLDRGLRTNYPFLDFVASHWTEIKTAFGDGFLQRFTRFSNETNAWNALLPVAHQNSEMVLDAEKAMEKYQELQTSAQGLRFLAKTKTRSPQLRAAALKAINGSGGSWMGFLPIDAACEILLDQFKDEQLAADLEDLVRKEHFTNGPMLALCLGWPESALVQGVLSHLNSMDELVAAYAFFSAATVERIIEKLPVQLHRAAYSSYWGRYVRRPLVLRLERDPGLGAALYDDMAQNPTPWKKCAYPHAIARTQGLTESTREWVFGEYDRQSSLQYTEFGYDVIYGDLRPVLHSLKDALSR